MTMTWTLVDYLIGLKRMVWRVSMKRSHPQFLKMKSMKIQAYIQIMATTR
jgi:hypothetical protein